MSDSHLNGLVAATFAPFNSEGAVDTSIVPDIVTHLSGNGIAGMFINGTTGEGPSLTVEERKQIGSAYISAGKESSIKSFINVGNESIVASAELAAHAAAEGADFIATTPPAFFKIESIHRLVEYLAEISAAAPDLPLYYYHIPKLSGGTLDMLQLLKAAERDLPNFAGIKYSSLELFTLLECKKYADGRYNMLFGCDEQLLAGIAMGADGAVGSTYNFMAPIYQRVIAAYDAGYLDEARNQQAKAAELVRILLSNCGFASLKTAMRFAGFDCGPLRLPNASPAPGIADELRNRLEAAGFFECIAAPVSV